MKSLPLSRRNFIKSGVATSTALTLATQLPSFAGTPQCLSIHWARVRV